MRPLTPAPPVESREPVTVGPSVSISGELTGAEDLVILGRVEGAAVNAPQHRVTVGASARVSADVAARIVVVEGELRGDVRASERVLVRSRGTLLGDITAPRVALADGCRYKGCVETEATGPVPRHAARPGGDAATTHLRHSLTLAGVLDHLAAEGRKEVIDLGPAVGANVERLAALGCRVHVLDVHDTLTAGARWGPEAAREPVPSFADDSVDAVLAWDVLDYLTAEQISLVMGRLAPACGRRGLMLVLSSAEARIPPAPLRYRIVDRETLAWEGTLEPSRPAPPWSHTDLARLLPGFEVRHSFLLRDHVREYLFAGNRTGQAPSPGERAPARGDSPVRGRWWFRRG